MPKLPFQADLVYHTHEFQGKVVTLTGTLKNNLPVDLEDVWIFFGERCYPIPGGLRRASAGGEGTKISLDLQSQKEIGAWLSAVDDSRLARRDKDFRSVQGLYNPTPLIRQAMFFQKMDVANTGRNHSLRFMDFSWRLQKAPGQGENRLREAILYAHVPFQRGPADELNKGAEPLPTKLWLGELPEAGKTQPTLAGTQAQDTYLRVLFPVRLSPN